MATAANLTYVTNLYSTILLRSLPVTDSNVISWATLIDSGLLTQAQAVSGFENSPEAQQFVFPIVRMYETFFHRAPDAAGLNGWVNAVRAGTMTIAQVAQGFVGSAEFASYFGANPNPTALVTALYQNVLGRTPDAPGLSAWVNVLTTGQFTAAQVALGFSESTEYKTNSLSGINAWFTAANANAQAGATTIYPSTITIVLPQTSVTLTTGVDTITNSGLAITGSFNGAAATFTAGDQITPGGTNNSLVLADLGTGGTTSPTGIAALTVSGIQTATFASGEALTVNTAASPQGWAGLTTLNVSEVSGATGSAITAAGTTAIKLTDTLSTGTDTVLGGSSVTVIASGIGTNGAITVGSATAAPTGAVTITASDSLTGAVAAGAITVTGGTTVSVTESTTNATVNTLATSGAVTVNGGASTTSVSVTQSAPVAAAPLVAGIADGVVAITDANGASTTKASTIATVSLDNFAAGASITSGALTSLTLADAGGAVTITDNLTAPTATTLNLAVNNLSTAAITDAKNEYTSISVTTGGKSASTIASITDTGLTTLTVAGTQGLTLGATPASVTAITVSGGAGLTATVGANTTFTSTSTGTDVISITAPATKAIAGNGTAGEEIVFNASGTGVTSLGTVTGFKVLGVGGLSSGTFDLSKLTGFSGLDVVNTAGGGVTFTKVTAGTSLTIEAAPAGPVTYQTADTAGATDTMSLTLGNATTAAGFAAPSVTLSDSVFNGIGIVNLVSNGSTVGTANTITAFSDASLSALTVSGTAGVSLGAFNDTATSLTINGNSTGTAAITLVGLTDNSLATLTTTGPDAVVITTLVDTAATVTLANTGTSTLTVTNPWADNNLTSLTLNGKVAVGITDTNATGITVAGGTDNSAVTFDATGGGAGVGKTDTITLGNGNDIVKDLGTGGTVNITLGTGQDQVTTGANTASVIVGAHTLADTFTVGANASLTVLTTLTGAAKGDGIVIADATSFVGAGVTLANVQAVAGDPTTLAGWVAGALGGAGANIGQHAATWFNFQGSTYIVEQSAVAGTAFGAGDTLVKIVGTLNESTAGFAVHTITL